METMVAPIPNRSLTEDLLSPELRVPQHEPSLSLPQPCQKRSPKAISTTFHNKKSTPKALANTVVQIDSVHNSLDRGESRIAKGRIDVLPQVNTHDYVAFEAKRSSALAMESANVQDENGDLQNDEDQRKATRHEGPNEERPISLINQSMELSEVTQHLSIQESLREAELSQSKPAQESSGARRPARQHSNVRIEKSIPQRPPTEQPKYPASPPVNVGQKSPFIKIFFWKNLKSSRKRVLSKHKATQADVRPPPTINARTAMMRGSLQNPNELPDMPNGSPAVPSLNVKSSDLPGPSSRLGQDAAVSPVPYPIVEPMAYLITEPINSSRLHHLKDGDLYVGKSDDLPIPKSLEDIWLGTTRKWLITDLKRVLDHLPKSLSRDESIIELVLHMSGKAEASSGIVHLTPSIWIHCGSQKCRDEIRKAVADISYLSGFTVHFRLDAPRFACNSIRCLSSVVRRATDVPQPSQGPHLSAGAIAGIVIGSVTALIAFVILAWWLLMRRRERFQDKRNQQEAVQRGIPPLYLIDVHSRQGRRVVDALGLDYPESSPRYLSPGSRALDSGDPLIRQISRPAGYGPIGGCAPNAMMASTAGSVTAGQGIAPTDEIRAFSPLNSTPGFAGLRAHSTNPHRIDIDPIDPPTHLATQEREPQSIIHIEPPSRTMVDAASNFQRAKTDMISTSGLRAGFNLYKDGKQTSVTSTIGGIIQVNGINYALTTAHQFFEALDWNDRIFEGFTSSIDSTSTFRPLRVSIGTNSQIWTHLILDLASYADGHHAEGRSVEKCLSQGTGGADFALLKIERGIAPHNVYYIPVPERSPTESQIEVSNFVPEDEKMNNGVAVVCSEHDLRYGRLLHESALFMNRAGVWETRKIHLEAPLEMGLSGAWVVQGPTLLGVIIAVYDREPYAHMLPIHKVLLDIRTSFARRAGLEISDVDVRLPASSNIDAEFWICRPPMPPNEGASTHENHVRRNWSPFHMRTEGHIHTEPAAQI